MHSHRATPLLPRGGVFSAGLGSGGSRSHFGSRTARARGASEEIVRRIFPSLRPVSQPRSEEQHRRPQRPDCQQYGVPIITGVSVPQISYHSIDGLEAPLCRRVLSPALLRKLRCIQYLRFARKGETDWAALHRGYATGYEPTFPSRVEGGTRRSTTASTTSK